MPYSILWNFCLCKVPRTYTNPTLAPPSTKLSVMSKKINCASGHTIKSHAAEKTLSILDMKRASLLIIMPLAFYAGPPLRDG